MKIDKIIYRQESSVAIHGELWYTELELFIHVDRCRPIHLKKSISGDGFYPIVCFSDTGEDIYQEGIREGLILSYEQSKQHETNSTI